MNAKDFVIPACSLLIVGAGAVTTLTSVAQEQKEIEERGDEGEISQAESAAQDAQLALTMQRLTKLEEIVQKIADNQIQTMQDIASLCTATGARCK